MRKNENENQTPLNLVHITTISCNIIFGLFVSLKAYIFWFKGHGYYCKVSH